MIIYRVENASGEGMYRNQFMHQFRDYDSGEPHPYDLDHPGPNEDGVLSDHYDDHEGWASEQTRGWGDYLRFGFASMAQLEAWIEPAWRAAMANGGMRIAAYEVADAIISDKQAIFDISTATLLYTGCLTEIGKQPDLPDITVHTY